MPILKKNKKYKLKGKGKKAVVNANIIIPHEDREVPEHIYKLYEEIDYENNNPKR